jgi:hypothetical protein
VLLHHPDFGYHFGEAGYPALAIQAVRHVPRRCPGAPKAPSAASLPWTASVARGTRAGPQPHQSGVTRTREEPKNSLFRSRGACGGGEELRFLVDIAPRAQFFKCRRGNTQRASLALAADVTARVSPRTRPHPQANERSTNGARANTRALNALRGQADSAGPSGNARCFRGSGVQPETSLTL